MPVRSKHFRGDGFTADGDDIYVRGQFASSAAAYAWAGAQPPELNAFLDVSHKRDRPERAWFVLQGIREMWPFEWERWFGAKLDARASLVKAGGFIITAIEKLDRDAARKAQAEREGA